MKDMPPGVKESRVGFYVLVECLTDLLKETTHELMDHTHNKHQDSHSLSTPEQTEDNQSPMVEQRKQVNGCIGWAIKEVKESHVKECVSHSEKN